MRALYSFIALLLIGCTVPAAPTKQYHTYHWDKSCQPLVVVLPTLLPYDMTVNTIAAMDYWNSILGAKVFVPFFTTFESPALFQTPHLRSRVCGLIYLDYEVPHPYGYGRGDFVGFSSMVPYNVDDLSLHAGTVQISSRAADAPTRFLTLVHELGHVVGLSHNTTNSKAIMSYSLTNTELIVLPNEVATARLFMGLE